MHHHRLQLGPSKASLARPSGHAHEPTKANLVGATRHSSRGSCDTPPACLPRCPTWAGLAAQRAAPKLPMPHKLETYKETPPPQLLSSASLVRSPQLMRLSFLAVASASILFASVILHSPASFITMAQFNVLSMVLILMASTVMDVGAVSVVASESKQTLNLSAVCSGSALQCLDMSDNLALPVETSSDDDVNLRDPSIGTVNDLQRDFFLEAALVKGGSLTLDENLCDPAPRRPFLTSVAAAAMPTTARGMIHHFGLAPSSPMAKDVATAAYLCGNPALPGEAFRCAASVDAVKSFVAAELGRNVNVYKTTGAPSSAPAVKAPVMIREVVKRSVAEGRRIVVCHHVAFPAMLFYCHRVTNTKVIQAALKPAGGLGSVPTINAVGVCHLDTSMWLSRHPAFKALNIAHGDAACHFLVDGDLVFTQAATESA